MMYANTFHNFTQFLVVAGGMQMENRPRIHMRCNIWTSQSVRGPGRALGRSSFSVVGSTCSPSSQVLLPLPSCTHTDVCLQMCTWTHSLAQQFPRGPDAKGTWDPARITTDFNSALFPLWVSKVMKDLTDIQARASRWWIKSGGRRRLCSWCSEYPLQVKLRGLHLSVVLLGVYPEYYKKVTHVRK